MSRIDELIKEKCPNGVKYVKLKNIVSIYTGKLNANSRVKNGKYLFFTCDAVPFKIDTYAFDGEAILISGNGSQVGHLNYYIGKFNAYQRTYVLMNFEETINGKFLFHYLKAFLKKHIDDNSKKGSVPYITLPMLTEFKIPVPPIEVQEEIVRILDKFSELESELEFELESELEARKKQYEYWRAKLFPHTNFFKINDICKKITSGGTPDTSNEKYFKGTIPWLRTQEVNWNVIMRTELKITKEAISNSSANIIPKNCVIVAMYGATVGKVAINGIELSTNQACCNLEIDETIANYKYVFYWLTYQYTYIKSLGRGSQTNINASIVKNLQLPLPPLEEQERIVNILDKFDKLVNDISYGIPEEIEARRKQYEYYRNKLLSFEVMQ